MTTVLGVIVTAAVLAIGGFYTIQAVADGQWELAWLLLVLSVFLGYVLDSLITLS